MATARWTSRTRSSCSTAWPSRRAAGWAASSPASYSPTSRAASTRQPSPPPSPPSTPSRPARGTLRWARRRRLRPRSRPHPRWRRAEEEAAAAEEEEARRGPPELSARVAAELQCSKRTQPQSEPPPAPSAPLQSAAEPSTGSPSASRSSRAQCTPTSTSHAPSPACERHDGSRPPPAARSAGSAGWWCERCAETTRPMAPSCSRSRSQRTDGLNCQFSSTSHTGARGPSSAITSRTRRAASIDGAAGFSESTCLPARSAASTAAGISGIGSTSSTASTSASAKSCSILAKRRTSRSGSAAWILASARAMDLRVREHTAARRTPTRRSSASSAGTCARSANHEQPTRPSLRRGGSQAIGQH
mmetsp:Transcript_42972/g.139452  ORF Transcript_42972/g.139452 Transcript_42972/m.139452 type:complete len:361 (-) Transcript_42972:63-1145(-)